MRTGGHDENEKISTPDQYSPSSSQLVDLSSESESHHCDVANPKYAPPTSEMEAVISFLMRTDFKKHVDLIEFIDLPGFQLSEDEEQTDFSTD